LIGRKSLVVGVGDVVALVSSWTSLSLSPKSFWRREGFFDVACSLVVVVVSKAVALVSSRTPASSSSKTFWRRVRFFDVAAWAAGRFGGRDF
jgi:hypothetical protein